jgi:hypothetical protein
VAVEDEFQASHSLLEGPEALGRGAVEHDPTRASAPRTTLDGSTSALTHLMKPSSKRRWRELRACRDTRPARPNCLLGQSYLSDSRARTSVFGSRAAVQHVADQRRLSADKLTYQSARPDQCQLAAAERAPSPPAGSHFRPQ